MPEKIREIVGILFKGDNGMDTSQLGVVYRTRQGRDVSDYITVETYPARSYVVPTQQGWSLTYGLSPWLLKVWKRVGVANTQRYYQFEVDAPPESVKLPGRWVLDIQRD